jgi:two-component system response regulator FixJ
MPHEGLVHVIEDDAVMRRSVAILLDAAGFAVRQYDDAKALLDDLHRVNGDCVLADIKMPSIDGLEMLRRIRAAGSPVRVVMMTGHGDVATAVRAMKLGAWDFIEKPFASEALIHAIRTAFIGEPDGIAHDAEIHIFLERLAQLSEREREVLQELLRGKTNKEIGRDLEISPRTVETYRAKIMMKTLCESIPELVRVAVRAGLV